MHPEKWEQEKKDAMAILGYASLILVMIMILISLSFFTQCGAEKKVDAIDDGKCAEGSTREASCKENESGKRLEACKEGAWVETFNDCKPSPSQACSKVAFDKDIQPILEANCKTCHSGFVNYSTAKSKIDQFIARINAEDPGKRMPKNSAPLSAADKLKFSKWKADGLILTCDDDTPAAPFIDLNYQEVAALQDINTVPLGSQRDIRWISIAHKSNEGEKKKYSLHLFRQSTRG